MMQFVLFCIMIISLSSCEIGRPYSAVKYTYTNSIFNNGPFSSGNATLNNLIKLANRKCVDEKNGLVAMNT